MAAEITPARSLLSRLGGLVRGMPWNSSPGPMTAPPFYSDAGWIPSNWPINFGQVGYDPIPGGWNSVVYSCIMLYARTIAQLPGRHQRLDPPTNGVDQVTNTALSRWANRPNDYQTPSDFMVNMVVSLLAEGNAIALGLRNDRNEFKEFHQFRTDTCRPLVGEDGSVFYSLGGNPVLDYRDDPAFYRDGTRYIVPARDILHFRGPASKNNILWGESPLVAAALPVNAYSGGFNHFWRFLQNMSRPSGVLSTDLVLTGSQVTELRERWKEHTTGTGAGGTPILSAGLKFSPYGITAQDIAIADQMKLSVADIARLFGVPLALINDMTGATFANTETLMTMWLRQGLGYYLNLIELAIDKTFAIDNTNDYYELDVDELLRPNFKERVDGLTKAITGGLYAPNEARKKEGLKKIKGGDEPRVQQQQVPLDWVGFEEPPKAPAAPGAAPAATDTPADGEDPPPDDAEKALFDQVKRELLLREFRGEGRSN